MNKRLKYTLIILLLAILCFVWGSVAIMLLVNSGFTNESSGQWIEISLDKKDDLQKLVENIHTWNETKTKYEWFEWFQQDKDYESQIAKYSISEIDMSWLGVKIEDVIKVIKLEWVENYKKSNQDIWVDNEELKKVYSCLRQWLLVVDSWFENTKMNFEKMYEVSNHLGYLIPSFSVYKNLCVQDPLGATQKKENIIKPWKFKDMIITDLHEWPFSHYIKDFMTNEKNMKELKEIASVLGIDENIIMSIVLVEQLRAAETDRDRVKQLAEKSLLNSFTMFSLGIAWMKVNTAEKIEAYLKDPNSEFYLGKSFEHLLDFESWDWRNAERQKRLTRNDTYYWQYLYTGISVKMFQEQWKKAWFEIDDKAWILWTLYNLWFQRSFPKNAPSLGGSWINYKWNSWLFGELAEKNFIFLLVDYEW